MGKDKKGFFKQNNWKQHPYKRPQNYNNKNEYVANKTHDVKQNAEKFNKVCLREDQVGIIEFLSNHVGFKGIIKSRFADFQVNEINLDNKIEQLDDLIIPHPANPYLMSDSEKTETEKDLNELIDAEMWAKLESLAKGNLKNQADIYIKIGELSKEKRTLIHKFFKHKYYGKLSSATVDKTTTTEEQEDQSNDKYIRVMRAKVDKRKAPWAFPGEYVYFLVHKENWDTIEAATTIANKIGLRPSQVNYCGTKDKRAITTQKFCVRRRTPQQIVGAIKTLKNIHCGNFKFGDKPLKLGDLRGNRFRIALRYVNGNAEEIEQALQNVRDVGFINYYGLQRFGNSALVPTYEIGIALLKSDYKLACELILKPRENDHYFMSLIRETWWKNRNSAEAAAMFHGNKFIEKKLLDGLALYGENDYATALKRLPRNLLLMYPHAFQSLIFNRIASKRIKEYGLKLLPGDLVCENTEELDQDVDISLLIEQNTEEIKDSPDNTNDLNEQNENNEVKNNDDIKNCSSKHKVKFITAEDIENGTYSISDVVLPKPGYDVMYPDNAVGKWYEEMLLEFELPSEKLRHNVKTYAIPGCYRKLLMKPKDMTWKYQHCDNNDYTLIASDWNILHGKKAEIEKYVEDGDYKALLLDFCLPTSTYATMLLRELMKIDTSSSSQILLENELKIKKK